MAENEDEKLFDIEEEIKKLRVSDSEDEAESSARDEDDAFRSPDSDRGQDYGDDERENSESPNDIAS